MAKLIPDSQMDSYLQQFRGGTNPKIVVCAGQPTDRASAIANSLVDHTDAACDLAVPGDFTLANGDVSGRKQTIAAKADLPIDTTGTADHVAIFDDTELLLVTTVTAQALTSGGTVSTSAFDHEIQDAA